MVKIKAPLQSATASGSLKLGLTFSRRSSGQQVRRQRGQADVTTSARTTQRGYFNEAVEKWNSLSAGEQGQWNDFIG